MKDFQSGNYISQGTYKSFQPTFINRKWGLQDMDIIQLLSQTEREIGRLGFQTKKPLDD